MHHLVYKTTNLINNKFYIGVHSTNNVNDSYLGSGKILNRAIKKYGKENFSRDILKIFPNKEMCFKYEEEILTKELLESPMCYNVKEGGLGGWDYVNNTPEISIRSGKTREGQGNGMYGKKHKKESKVKMSINRKGINTGPQSKEHIENKRLSKCKTYHVFSPDKTEYIVNDLVDFCNKHNLAYKTMSKLPLNGRQPNRGKCSGWRCDFYNEQA